MSKPDQPTQRQLLEQAVLQLREARQRLAEADRRLHEPVAVIGAAVRSPGGVTDLDSLWQVLRAGRDAVGPWADAPDGRRDAGRPTGRWAGLLDQVDGFDAGFFGIGGEEADHIDPQQRLLLEAAWEAIEDAGLPAERLRERPTGAFLGLYGTDYLTLQLSGQAGITAYTGPGGAHSIAANRISFLLDLHGPSLAVDTACSSSLVAVHLAIRALRSGECDFALVGGVNVVLSEPAMAATGKVLPMATGGRCRTFDAAADGIVRAEGCGVLLLERQSDAQAGGHRVRALLRGSAVNHNGRTNGLTAPSPRSQAAVIRAALADAAADPRQVLYVEAHGTGTRLGDPIEVEAIREVYGTGEVPCAIGSAKANFGHQEAAAGIIGLLKAVLVLDRGQVPPAVHLDQVNPEIDLAGSRITIPAALTELPAAPRRLAAVSSFGFGGTNAHVVLEAAVAAPGAAPAAVPGAGGLLLPLSARSAPALGRLVSWYADRLAAADPALAGAICAAAALGRSHHRFRVCASGRTPADLAAELRAVRPEFARASDQAPRVAFVFSGQGSQWAGMGRELIADEPAVRAEVAECDAIVRELAGWSVTEELSLPDEQSGLARTETAQVCIAVLQWGLAALWRSWGVEPFAVTGHSMGEIAAAREAGVLSRRQALGLLITRARLAEQGARGGAMAELALPADEAAAIVAATGGRLGIAAVNSLSSTVVAGEAELVARAADAAVARGARARRLPVGYGFHSPLLDGLDDRLADALRELVPGQARLPLYSTVTGERVRAADLGPDHWGRNLRAPVLFKDAVSALARDGVTAFVEVGPHPVLLRDIHATLGAGPGPYAAVGSLRRDTAARATLNDALAGLYRAGLDIRWEAVTGPHRGLDVPLPLYPWQRSRHWLTLHQAGPAAPDGPVPEAEPDAARPGPLAATAPADLEEALLAYVQEQFAGLNPDAAAIAPDAGFDTVGLNSLMIVELRNRIERDFGATVPLQVLLDGGSVRAVAQAAAKHLGSAAAEPADQ